jgi:hypothetical protein
MLVLLKQARSQKGGDYMRLLDEALQKRFAEIGRQDDMSDPIVITKFFNPSGAGTWWATEFDPETGEFFGYVSIIGGECDEWGYFSLAELESYVGPFGQQIERDLTWRERLASRAIPGFKGFGK